MLVISHNRREIIVPRSEVPVIKMEKFEVRQVIDDDGISHSSVTPVDPVGVLDLPFRAFSMESYNATGEISRLQFQHPKHVDSLDVFDRISGDLSEISAKVDHMTLMQSISNDVSSSPSDVKQ